MKLVAALRDSYFESLQGLEVKLMVKDEFPIPQDEGYAQLGAMDSHLLSWREKAKALDTTISIGQKHAAAASFVPVKGWATKESCRRPSERFSLDVVTTLRRCFDAVPRLNNYQIQSDLRRKFRTGPNVLRISQISGWVSSEVKRRKNAALAAAADVANMAAQAAEKGQKLYAGDYSVFNEHANKAMGAGLNDVQITSCVLDGWKRVWRRRRYQRCPMLESATNDGN